MNTLIIKEGLDHEGSVGIGGAIVRDGIQPKTVLNLAFGFFGIAILLGVYICINSSWWLAAIGLVCMAVAYLYTGGPLPIAYTPFGELTAGLFMGVIIIGISFFIQTGTVTSEVILLIHSSSILIGAILLANNIRDLDGDKENGRKTLAILVGRVASGWCTCFDVHRFRHLDNCFNYRGHRITMDAYRIFKCAESI